MAHCSFVESPAKSQRLVASSPMASPRPHRRAAGRRRKSRFSSDSSGVWIAASPRSHVLVGTTRQKNVRISLTRKKTRVHLSNALRRAIDEFTPCNVPRTSRPQRRPTPPPCGRSSAVRTKLSRVERSPGVNPFIRRASGRSRAQPPRRSGTVRSHADSASGRKGFVRPGIRSRPIDYTSHTAR